MTDKVKKEKIASIRSQLFSWLLIPIVSLCLVSAVISYVIAINITTEAYDAALTESARELANRLKIIDGKVLLDLPPAALAIFKEDKVDKSYYAAFDDAGNLIGGDPEILPIVNLLNRKIGPTESSFLNRKINSSDVRLVCTQASVPEMPSRKALIYVAETVLKRQALINEILEAVILPQLCLIGFAALAVWFGVARGLAPLDTVRSAIASRTQWDLRPVTEVKAPIEIQPLMLAIDDLLARLNEYMESQHRFIANAAHQLRTPLAGIKTQTELAMRADNWQELSNILKQINQGATNATRLVNQLLVMAKLEPSSAWLGGQTEIDLNAVIKEATSDLVPFAVEKEIDLGFEGSHEPAIIKGDKTSIRELVTNLIDNAIRYTPEGGKVTVKVAASKGFSDNQIDQVNESFKDRWKNIFDSIDNNNTFDIMVEDNGPGIPLYEREKVFERFYRVLGNNVSGSGLGLAIVREIVQAHEAKVWIESGQDGKGTVANVRFPAALVK